MDVKKYILFWHMPENSVCAGIPTKDLPGPFQIKEDIRNVFRLNGKQTAGWEVGKTFSIRREAEISRCL